MFTPYDEGIAQAFRNMQKNNTPSDVQEVAMYFIASRTQNGQLGNRYFEVAVVGVVAVVEAIVVEVVVAL